MPNLYSWISNDVDEERDERCGLKNRLSFRFNVVHLKSLGGEYKSESLSQRSDSEPI